MIPTETETELSYWIAPYDPREHQKGSKHPHSVVTTGRHRFHERRSTADSANVQVWSTQSTRHGRDAEEILQHGSRASE